MDRIARGMPSIFLMLQNECTGQDDRIIIENEQKKRQD
jgi:hypothetical protein